MFNDIVEIKLNDKKYSARLDMGAIANAQNNLQKTKKNMTIVEMFNNVGEENYSVINNLMIESIRRCHPQLNAENILEDMKLKEKDHITLQVYELMKVALPIDENDKKKVMEDQ
nr:hypothetical protein [[Eubacterium] tenue]